MPRRTFCPVHHFISTDHPVAVQVQEAFERWTLLVSPGWCQIFFCDPGSRLSLIGFRSGSPVMDFNIAFYFQLYREHSNEHDNPLRMLELWTLLSHPIRAGKSASFRKPIESSRVFSIHLFEVFCVLFFMSDLLLWFWDCSQHIVFTKYSCFLMNLNSYISRLGDLQKLPDRCINWKWQKSVQKLCYAKVPSTKYDYL